MTSADAILDSLGMFALTAGLPEQAEKAAATATEVVAQMEPWTIDNVVILGMGGSAMAGEVVAAAASSILPVPVIVSRSYECPAFVSADSLVFAISASGQTEETVQAASDAAETGALLVVVAGRTAGRDG